MMIKTSLGVGLGSRPLWPSVVLLLEARTKPGGNTLVCKDKNGAVVAHLWHHFALASHDADAQDEGEYEDVLVEQAPADLGVHRVRELRLQVGDALLDLRLLLGLDDGLVVDGDEPGQGELVHWVDVLQLDDAEEEDGSVVSHWAVTVTCCINFFFRCCGNFLLGSNFLR